MTTDTHSDPAPHDAVPHDEHAAHDQHDGDDHSHWSDIQYVQLALGLAIITGIEVLLSYMKDDIGWIFLPALLTLMAIKFFAVVMYFMHLKFDNKLFSLMFYMGLGLAVVVYSAALFTFKFFSP
jgi:cytochrome c oxidase subunit IV